MPYVGGLYGGVTYQGALVNNIEQVNNLDEKIKQIITDRKEDSVVSIFMMPYPFFSDGINPVMHNLTINRPTTLDGYQPKNNKLLTYPYVFLTVDAINDSHDYYFEQSEEAGLLRFFMVCGMSPNPEIITYPYDYNGFTGYNPTESVTCTGFPQCAFTIDSYRAWLAQKAFGQVATAITTGAGAIGTALAATTGVGAIAAGVLGAVGMASQVGNMTKEATQGSKTRGNQGSSTDVAIRQKKVVFKTMSVTYEYAKMIDDFFDRYGYACCQIKIPNRNVRPYWTYTQTQNCSLSGFVPSDDLAKIKSIYDKGITFWNDGTHVGNYSLDNSIN